MVLPVEEDVRKQKEEKKECGNLGADAFHRLRTILTCHTPCTYKYRRCTTGSPLAHSFLAFSLLFPHWIHTRKWSWKQEAGDGPGTVRVCEPVFAVKCNSPLLSPRRRRGERGKNRSTESPLVFIYGRVISKGSRVHARARTHRFHTDGKPLIDSLLSIPVAYREWPVTLLAFVRQTKLRTKAGRISWAGAVVG